MKSEAKCNDIYHAALSKIWGVGCDKRYGARCALAVTIKPWCPPCIARHAFEEASREQ